jgi:fluoroacetyl-CoA thioesterase
VDSSFDSVQRGLEGRTEQVIDTSQLTAHVGGAGLFATPSMIRLMEEVAHDAVAPNLPDGHTTVGYEVCVRHLAPARQGEAVVVTARLEEVTGNHLHFAVECTKDDGDTLVGSGTHKRTIIPVLG